MATFLDPTCTHGGKFLALAPRTRAACRECYFSVGQGRLAVGGIVFFSVTAAGNLISTLLWRMIVVASDKLVATPTARTLMTYDNEATGTAHVEQLQVRRWVMGQGG